MAYRFDSYDQSIVLDGHEAGVADSPYAGVSDMRNVNITSVPGEAAVNFSTSQTSESALVSATVTSLSGSTLTFTGGTGLENGMCIYFTSYGSLTGVSLNTPYWVYGCAGSPTTSCTLYSNYGRSTNPTLGGTAGGATFVSYNVASPNHFVFDGTNYYMQDTSGQVWSNLFVTTSGKWTYTGPSGTSDTSQGNGLVYYPSSNNGVAFTGTVAVTTGGTVTGTNTNFLSSMVGGIFTSGSFSSLISGYSSPTSIFLTTHPGTAISAGSSYTISYASQTKYIFAFNSGSIDYFEPSTSSWVWGWNPATGTPNNSASYLNTTGVTHNALVGQDNTVYFCDGSYLESFFENIYQVTGQHEVFNPLDTTTYTFSKYALSLPNTESAQCFAELGITLLTGTLSNKIYPWNRTSIQFDYPIFLSESNVQQMVTVNTTTYIFVGNRGRIYMTNGTNAQFYKKIPDHISGTIEPYFTWGGATFLKNQLYFGVSATDNSGTVIPQYGGVWAIDLDTNALRLTNQLSYASYSGIVKALIAISPNYLGNPIGSGLYIGWDNSTTYGGTGTFGIDKTSSAPYNGSQYGSVDYDLIPIGTFNKTRDLTLLEYRLTTPLKAGETIKIYTRLIFNTSTGGSTGYALALTDIGDGVKYSNSIAVNFHNAQWLQVQTQLYSISSFPSYVRLKEIRLLGLVGPTLATNENLSL